MALARRYAILITTDWPLLANQFLFVREDVGGSVKMELRMFGENPHPARLWPKASPRELMVYRVSRLVVPLSNGVSQFSDRDKARYVGDVISALQHDIFREIYG